MLVITQKKMDDKILMRLLRVVTFRQILVRSDSNDNVGEHDVVEWNEYDDVDAVIDGVDKYDGDGDGDGVGRVRVGDVGAYTDRLALHIPDQQRRHGLGQRRGRQWYVDIQWYHLPGLCLPAVDRSLRHIFNQAILFVLQFGSNVEYLCLGGGWRRWRFL